MRRPSNQSPTDPPLRTGTEKESSQVLGLAVASCVSIDNGNISGAAQSLVGPSLATATLQTQQVRIQT
jgi:hypothetical protein